MESDIPDNLEQPEESLKRDFTTLIITPYREVRARSQEKIQYLVDELLIEGGMSVISGRPKHGKSTVVRALIGAVSKGNDFLGRKTKQGAILYIQLEEPNVFVSQQLEKVGVLGENIFFGERVGPANSGKRIKHLKQAIFTYRPALLVIDPFARFTACEDLNEYGPVYKELSEIIEIARTNGTHVLIVHHANKSGTGDQNSILGSTAIAGAVDSLIYLRKAEGFGYIQSEQRCGKGLPLTRLTIQDGVITDFIPCRDVTASDIKHQVLEYLLAKANLKVTQEVLLKEIPGRRETTLEMLKSLEQEGLIGSEGGGKKGDPRKYFSIPRGLEGGKESEASSGELL